jgi:hypothetical protein
MPSNRMRTVRGLRSGFSSNTDVSRRHRMLLVLAVFLATCLSAYMVGSSVALLGGPSSRAARVVIGGVAAIGAVVFALDAAGAPSGSPIADKLYRGALGLVVSVAATRAAARFAGAAAALLAAGCLAASTSVTTIALVLAGVAVGLSASQLRPALGSGSSNGAAGISGGDVAVSAPLDQPIGSVILSCLGGVALGNAALRLPTSLPTLLPSIIATAGVLILTMSAVANISRRARRLTAATVVLGIAGGGAVTTAAAREILDVRATLERGVSETRAGLAAAKRGETEEASAQFAAGSASLVEARAVFGSPMVSLARQVPVVGANIKVLRSLSTAAIEVTTNAETAIGALDLADLRMNDGRIAVDRIEALEGPLQASSDALTRAQFVTAAVRGPWLVSEVVSRSQEFQDELVEAQRAVDEASVIVDALPPLLGADGPRRYLLVVQTPTEARGSGGLIGSFGEITAADGKVRLERFGRTIELNEGGVPGSQRTVSAPEDYLSRYGRFEVAQLWQNVNLSPDFPSSAMAMDSLYPQSGGTEIDGVISVDPYALAAFLSITGPVTVDGWPEAITTESAPKILFYDFYQQLTEERNEERIDLQGEVALTAWTRLLTGPLPTLRDLSASLAQATKGRHLQVWAERAEEQQLMRQIGVDGSFRSSTGDYFGLISNNAGANKIDWYLRRTIDYQVTVDPATDTAKTTAVITLVNDAPSTGAARYLIGNKASPPAPEGTSVQYVSIYSPFELTSTTIDGKAIELERESELGMNVYSAWIRIPPQGSAKLVVQLTGSIALEGFGGSPYRLRFGCQAMVNADIVSGSITVRGEPQKVTEFLVAGSSERSHDSSVEPTEFGPEPLTCGRTYSGPK